MELLLVRVTLVVLPHLFWEGDCEHWSHSRQASGQAAYGKSFQTWPADVRYVLASECFHDQCQSLMDCVRSLLFSVPWETLQVSSSLLLVLSFGYHLLITFLTCIINHRCFLNLLCTLHHFTIFRTFVFSFSVIAGLIRIHSESCGGWEVITVKVMLA